MVLLLPLYNKRSANFIHNLVLFLDGQSFLAIIQKLSIITSKIVVSTSKNSSLEITPLLMKISKFLVLITPVLLTLAILTTQREN